MSEGSYIKGDIGEYREMCEKIAHGDTQRKLEDVLERNIKLCHDIRIIKSCWWYRVGKFLRLCR